MTFFGASTYTCNNICLAITLTVLNFHVTFSVDQKCMGHYICFVELGKHSIYTCFI